MKKIIRRFEPRTILAVLLVLFAVTAATVWAAENRNSDTKNEIDLQFSTKVQLTAYVDGAWSDELSEDYGFGDTANLTAPATSGDKSFSHWEADGSVISYSNPLKLTMNAHTTLYAVYADAEETKKPVSGFTSIVRTNEGNKISFQAIAGGGTVEGAGIVYSTTVSGETLKIGGTGVTEVAAVKSADLGNTIPDSVLDGNNCWMLQIAPDGDSTSYYARTYVTIGGTTTYGDVKDVKLSDLESGISLVADPDGMHPDGENESTDIADLLADMKTYNVTFDANGGTGTMALQAVLDGVATALNTNTFTRDNYTFGGWSTEKNGGGTTYSDGQNVTFSADTTLYAQWKQDDEKTDPSPTPQDDEKPDPSPAPQDDEKPDPSTTPQDDKQSDSSTASPTPQEDKNPAADRVTKTEKAKAKIALNKGVKVSSTGNKITIKWGKVSKADRYVVYAAYCGSGKCTKIKTLSGSKQKYTFKNLKGKKLNAKKHVRAYVVAYRKVNGKETKLAKSLVAHIAGSKSTKYTNVKEIKLLKKEYTLNVNKTVKIKASIILKDKKKKKISKSHAPDFRYASSDTKIATVDKNGKIKAVGKGKCYVYVYAHNGYPKKIKVTVKSS